MICSSVYEYAFSNVKAIVDVNRQLQYCITAEVWSHTSAGVSLLSVTAHAVTEKFVCVNFLLIAEPLQERHTGEYIYEL